MTCRLIFPDQLPNIIISETYIINLLIVRYCPFCRYNKEKADHTNFHLTPPHSYASICIWNKKQFWLLPLKIFTALKIKIPVFYCPYS